MRPVPDPLVYKNGIPLGFFQMQPAFFLIKDLSYNEFLAEIKVYQGTWPLRMLSSYLEPLHHITHYGSVCNTKKQSVHQTFYI